MLKSYVVFMVVMQVAAFVLAWVLPTDLVLLIFIGLPIAGYWLWRWAVMRTVKEKLGTSQVVQASSTLKSYIAFVLIERVFYFFGGWLNWNPWAVQFTWVFVLGYWVWREVLSRMVFRTLQIGTALALLGSVQAAAQAVPKTSSASQKTTTQESPEVRKIRQAAEQGDPIAQHSLGLLYLDGLGVPQDVAQAGAWFRKAAEQGLASAQYNLGFFYVHGQGQPDYLQAVPWYRKAAEQGNANAQYNLALLYMDGRGVPQDIAQAGAWFRKAADQGLAVAQYNVGVLYDNGQGMRQDFAQAAVWYRKAAEQGDANAQYNLGALYGNGQGVPQDFVETHKWFALASARATGDDRKRFLEARDAVEKMMTSTQVAEARKHAREWQDAFERRNK